MLTPKTVLGSMIGLLVLNSALIGWGSYVGYPIVVQYGVKIGEFAWPAVIGALASAMSAFYNRPAAPNATEHPPAGTTPAG
jgi:hypothetical protein